MIGDLLSALPKTGWGTRFALIGESSGVTWRELQGEFQRLRSEYQELANQRVAVCFACTGWGLATLAALESLGCDVVLLDAYYPEETAKDLARTLDVLAVLRATDGSAGPSWVALATGSVVQPASGNCYVTLLTSGTTGNPKPVRHTWASLSRPVRRGTLARQSSAWLVTYQPHLYAGLQVILQGLALGDTLAVPSRNASPDEITQLMLKAHVEFVSATPSYWRKLILFSDRLLLQQVPLQQITLGGEIVDQQVLDQLNQIFPHTRISHIYATTELGRCFSVTDGLAGFPTSYLTSPIAEGTRLKIDQDELFVRSPNSTLECNADPIPIPSLEARDETWVATGDLVKIEENRVYFVGRQSEMINVGGNKVQPAIVENIVREVPGVLDVRVYGKTSSVAGQIVACQVVNEAGIDATQLRQDIHQYCRSRLLPAQVPRFIDFVAQIELTT
ncbi:MAG: class I adenylate-forming enzyme family protein [Planctomycetota bacterium]|nr:class I adenylate-forming enzyme family protein [Planctomycetota bacterium]